MRTKLHRSYFCKMFVFGIVTALVLGASVLYGGKSFAVNQNYGGLSPQAYDDFYNGGNGRLKQTNQSNNNGFGNDCIPGFKDAQMTWLSPAGSSSGSSNPIYAGQSNSLSLQHNTVGAICDSYLLSNGSIPPYNDNPASLGYLANHLQETYTKVASATAKADSGEAITITGLDTSTSFTNSYSDMRLNGRRFTNIESSGFTISGLQNLSPGIHTITVTLNVRMLNYFNDMHNNIVFQCVGSSTTNPPNWKVNCPIQSAKATVVVNIQPPPPSCTVDAPSSVLAGDSFNASFNLYNVGSFPLLGSLNPTNTTRWGNHRVTITFNPTVGSFTAPTTPGTYNFDWGLVKDGSGGNWYGGYQNPTIVCHKQIEVTPPSSDTPSCTLSVDSTGTLLTLTGENVQSESINASYAGNIYTNNISLPTSPPTGINLVISPPPGQTSTYTATVYSGTGLSGTSATCSKTYTPPSVPSPSCTLSIGPTEIWSGESTNITWSTSNADSISSNFGETGSSGSTTVSPTTTTTYTITPKKGSTTGAPCSKTVTVTTNPNNKPAKCKLTPLYSPIESGETPSIHWDITDNPENHNISNMTIGGNGEAHLVYGAHGQVDFQNSISSDATYTLVGTDDVAGQTVACSTTVKVKAPNSYICTINAQDSDGNAISDIASGDQPYIAVQIKSASSGGGSGGVSITGLLLSSPTPNLLSYTPTDTENPVKNYGAPNPNIDSSGKGLYNNLNPITGETTYTFSASVKGGNLVNCSTVLKLKSPPAENVPACSLESAVSTTNTGSDLVKGVSAGSKVTLTWTLNNYEKDKMSATLGYSGESATLPVDVANTTTYDVSGPDLEGRINGGDHALSYILTINYTGSDGKAASTTCNASVPIIFPGNYPYIRATNNDTWSGALFSTSPDSLVCSNYDTSDPFTKQTLDLAGQAQVATNGVADPTKPLNSSSSDYGIFSTGLNNIDTYPFLGRNGTQNNLLAPSRYDLTFANWPDTEYGKFTAEPLCLPDYYSIYDTAKADTKDVVDSDGVKRHTIDNLTNLSQPINKKYLLHDIVVKKSGDITLSSLFDNANPSPDLTVPKLDFVTLLVDGNLTIDRNIKYNPIGVLGSFSMPSFIAIVKGDINITSNVTELNGIFIAQPSVSDPDSDGKYTINSTGGNIDTCSNIGSKPHVDGDSIIDPCNNSLQINGSLVAQTISLNRLRGSIKTGHTLDNSCLAATNIDSCAAEWDKFDPSVYLSSAYGITPDVKSLLGQVQSTRNLPPIY